MVIIPSSLFYSDFNLHGWWLSGIMLDVTHLEWSPSDVAQVTSFSSQLTSFLWEKMGVLSMSGPKFVQNVKQSLITGPRFGGLMVKFFTNLLFSTFKLFYLNSAWKVNLCLKRMQAAGLCNEYYLKINWLFICSDLYIL